MKKLLIKYKPQLLYMFFGFFTMVIDVGVYQLCFSTLYVPNVLSNIISWGLSVAFSFITNKIWVYGSKSMKAKTLLKEGFAYFTGRGISLIVGTAMMVFGVDIMQWDSFVMKLVSTVIIIIINYGFGFFVFKKLEEGIQED